MMASRLRGTSIWIALGGMLLLSSAGLVTRANAAIDTMYPDDANRQLKESIEDTYGIYILNPSRRNAAEKVEIKGETVELWLYYDPRKPDYDKQKCEAYKWIMLGRFGVGGAKPFFEKFPHYKYVDLVVYRLVGDRTLDKEGNYHISKTPSVYMKMRLSRARAQKLDWAAVTKELKRAGEPKGPDDSACVRTAERWVDAHWYNTREYFK